LPVYEDTKDRLNFLKILEDVASRYNRVCHGYCLMDKVLKGTLVQNGLDASWPYFENGYSMAEIARHIGLHYTTIGRIINAEI
jgi:hypothetical protein